jgi:hypothetical protein
MFDEYRRSLKMPEAEEFFDLAFYRPLGYLTVRLLYPLPLTPNHVTGLSLAAGLQAAWQFSHGSPSGLAYGALLYALANILDCADGQLARLKKKGTPLGRVIDGVFDYISSVAIFIGLGWALSGSGGNSAWWLVVAAGVSSALHALFFDHYQGEFISAVKGERNFVEREVEQFAAHLQRASGLRKYLLALYLKYLRMQQRANTRHEGQQFNPGEYRRANLVMIRLWSMLGPTTNRTILIISALAGHAEFYLWFVAVAGNAWLLVCYLKQRTIHARLRTSRPVAAEGTRE